MQDNGKFKTSENPAKQRLVAKITLNAPEPFVPVGAVDEDEIDVDATEAFGVEGRFKTPPKKPEPPVMETSDISRI